jgi:hypothetical protein
LSILASTDIRDVVGPVIATQLQLEMPATGAFLKKKLSIGRNWQSGVAVSAIGVEIGQVVPLTSAPATDGIERHFALTGRGHGGENLCTAASRARC